MKRIILLFLLGGLLASCKPAEGPQVVAHRGYWDIEGSAQNSIASILEAGRIGCYGSEFDVNLTADGALVVNHDFTYKGMEIYKSTLEELRCDTLRLANGEIIPTLDEYLEAAAKYPDMRLVFELKSEGDPVYEAAAIPACIEAVKRAGALERTDFICFSLSACKEFARLLPGNTVEYLEGDLSPKEVKELGINGIDYHYSVFDEHPEWVDEAHSLGMVVNVWTVNKEEDIRRMLGYGIDQITTNAPELAQRLIKELAEKK